MMRKLHIIYIYALTIACIACMVSCNVEVPLHWDIKHPHTNAVRFIYDWQGATDTPDSMYVIAYRRVNNLKYNIKTTAYNSEYNQVEILYPDTAKYTNAVAVDLRSGHYELLTFNNIDGTIGDGVNDEFFSKAEFGFDSVRIVYPMVPHISESPALIQEFGSWIDHNPYSGFIIDHNTLFVDMAEIESTVESHNRDIKCTFTPKKRSQKVNVNFNVEILDEGINIDNISAEMAGVSTTIYPFTGKVDILQTGKVLFSPTFDNTIERNEMKVNGSFVATGIVRPANNSTLLGPGIMQLNISASITQDINGKAFTYHKVFRAIINLYNTLQATPSLVYDEELQYFKQTEPEITLSIGSTMQITREKILSQNKADEDEWLDAGFIYIDM